MLESELAPSKPTHRHGSDMTTTFKTPILRYQVIPFANRHSSKQLLYFQGSYNPERKVNKQAMSVSSDLFIPKNYMYIENNAIFL